MREFGSENNSEFKAIQDKRPNWLVRKAKLWGSRLVMLGGLMAAKEGLAPNAAEAAKHRVEKSPEVKNHEARVEQLNKWLLDFHIKNLGVLKDIKQENGHEVVDLFLKGIVQATLDSGGYIYSPFGKEEVGEKATEFNEDLLKKQVILYLEKHTDFKVIDEARPGAEKKVKKKH